MKLDIKSWIIIILLIVTIFFVGKWYFRTDEASANSVTELESKIEELEKERMMRDSILLDLRENQVGLEKEILTKEGIVAELSEKNVILNTQSNIAKAKLAEIKKELKETQNAIKLLQDNPSKKEGDELLNSLKNNLR